MQISPPQFHVITVGAFAGAFGSLFVAPLLQTFVFGPESDSHYGLRIATSVVTGVLLPRMVLSMDISDHGLWNLLGRLSTA